MADTNWFLQGKWLEYCNCDHGCPCEAMAPPTFGHCHGLIAMKIDEGYFWPTRLDGLTVAATFYFPHALHHGNGHLQPFVEERANEDQRQAIFTILSGQGQPPNTIFNIFSIIIEHHHHPIFAPITFDWDIQQRTASISVDKQFRAKTTPIRNPVTDEMHRMRTVLPDGWVFHEAEVASGEAKSIGEIKFDHAKRHSSLAYFAFDNNGMAFSYAEAKRRYGLDQVLAGD
jgi:hypothetical protein